MADQGHSSSLRRRLLLAASVALVCFLGFTGWVLDKAFRDAVQTAEKDRLQTEVFAILAASELDDSGLLIVPDILPDGRFGQPDSGLYAAVSGAGQTWRSQSMIGAEVEINLSALRPGEIRFETPNWSEHEPVFRFSQGFAWEAADGQETTFGIHVAEHTKAYEAQINQFRRSLWGWLAAAAVLLLAVQGSTLSWSLLPLRRLATQLNRVESGKQDEIQGRYPRELQGLAGNINQFIRGERQHLARYRNSLADLAHSLKTPLAVIRSESETLQDSDQILKQVERMDSIVAHQLRRAGTSGHLTLAKPVAVGACAEQLVDALDKLHRSKNVACEFDLAEDVQFFGDEGDLIELLGNLLENAYKWCDSRVVLRASNHGHGPRPGCLIQVDDDGAGIEDELAESVLQRGVRADEQTDGHGLGLAMVSDIAKAYGAKLTIGRSEWGGARIQLDFPARDTDA